MIAIIGMHRSGTSAIAGGLHKLGGDLGSPSAWLPAAADNPRGFFEYAPVVDLNRSILAALGGTWSSPPPLRQGWVDDERLDRLKEEAVDVSARISRHMVVKDPRLSLLLPLWRTVVEIPSALLCLRHPMAVAESLLERNELSIEQSLFLWFRYNTAAILNHPDALILEYEDLLSEPVTTLGRAADYLDLPVSEKVLNAASESIYRSMAHHEGADIPDSPVGIMCQRLYALLRSGDVLETDESLYLWAMLTTELPWAGPADQDINRIRREVTELELEVDRHAREYEHLASRYRRLEAELRRAWQAVDIVSLSETLDLTRQGEVPSNE